MAWNNPATWAITDIAQGQRSLNSDPRESGFNKGSAGGGGGGGGGGGWGAPTTTKPINNNNNNNISSNKNSSQSDSGGGGGDVTGPASSVDNSIARLDGVTGKVIQSTPHLTLSDDNKFKSSTHTNIELLSVADIEISSGAGVGQSVNITADIDGVVSIKNDNLVTNEISERTSSSGVTIDGTLIKDGLVDGRDLSVDGTRLDAITDANYKNSNTTKAQVGLSNVDNTSDASLTNTIISTIYPVGSLYTSTDATNPGTSLGVGTWAAFGQGRVLVGKASSGTFSSAGATVGTETHVLTISEMPAHTHSSGRTAGTSGSFGLVDSASASSSGTWNTLSTGGGGSHNNIQPSVVVYMWKRTA